MLARSAEALFAHLIDYAGLFPPAALPMADAVRNYGTYRHGEYAWMLGRFVLSAGQIDEAMTAALPAPQQLSTIHEYPESEVHAAPHPPFGHLLPQGEGSHDSIPLPPGEGGAKRRVRGRDLWGSSLAMTDLSVLAAPNAFPEGADVVETKAATAEAIAAIEAGDRTVYVEVSDLDLIDALAAAGLRAKIRTGGVTTEAFPAATHVAAFIRRCAARGVAFKATAGLHHPIRCLRPLTYAANAPRGTMHGFINVFLAAALPAHAESILTEDDPHAFTFDDDAAAWRGHAVHTEDLLDLRREFAISFGSCSFEEPIADLKELGWL